MSNTSDFDPLFAPEEVGPPRAHPWDEYAAEKIKNLLFEQELELESANQTATAWAAVGFFACAAGITNVFLQSEPASLSDLLVGFGTFLIGFICLVIRLYGIWLSSRLRRRQRNIDRYGVRYL